MELQQASAIACTSLRQSMQSSTNYALSHCRLPPSPTQQARGIGTSVVHVELQDFSSSFTLYIPRAAAWTLLRPQGSNLQRMCCVRQLQLNNQKQAQCCSVGTDATGGMIAASHQQRAPNLARSGASRSLTPPAALGATLPLLAADRAKQYAACCKRSRASIQTARLAGSSPVPRMREATVVVYCGVPTESCASNRALAARVLCGYAAISYSKTANSQRYIASDSTPGVTQPAAACASHHHQQQRRRQRHRWWQKALTPW